MAQDKQALRSVNMPALKKVKLANTVTKIKVMLVPQDCISLMTTLRRTKNMKTSNYLYVSHSQMYGMLHGMHTGGCLDTVTLNDAKEIASSEAYDIVTGYDCIMEAIHEDINDQFGYEETPEEPDEETGEKRGLYFTVAETDLHRITLATVRVLHIVEEEPRY